MAEMRTFEILPGDGVPPIRFGMAPDDVRQAMGEPDRGSIAGAWIYGALLVTAMTTTVSTTSRSRFNT